MPETTASSSDHGSLRRWLAALLASALAAVMLTASPPESVAAAPVGNGFSDTFDGGSASWTPFAGSWAVESGEFSQGSTTGGANHAALVGKRFDDATYELDLKAISAASGSWAGIQFKKMRPEDGPFDSGLTVYVRPDGTVELYRINTVIATASTGLSFASMRHLRVVNSGDNVKVYVNNETSPRLDVNDSTFASGYMGLVAFSSHWHFDNVAIAAPELAYTIDLGNEEVLYHDFQMPIGMDSSFATLRKDANTLYYDMVNPGNAAGLTRYEGTPDKPLTTLVFTKPNMSFIDLNGHNAGWGTYEVWMPNYYRIGPNELIAFTHNEMHPSATQRKNPPDFSMGIAYSSDNGATWEFCGEILKPKDHEVNVGGSPYVIRNGSFYLYFNEGDVSPNNTSAWTRKVSAARASVADVVAAARNHTVTPWLKYKNGAFTENALTGMGSPVIPSVFATAGDKGEDSHADATYSTALGKYLMTVQTEYASKLTMYSSADAVTWSMEAYIDVMPTGGHMQPYSSFVDLEGASDDGSVVDDDFYVMYERKPYGQFFHDTLMRKQVTITKNMDARFIASSGFSSTQGSNQWSYEQKSGSTFSAMSWDAANRRWKGTAADTLVGGAWQHPDTQDSVRTWTAPTAGSILVAGTPRKSSTAIGGDGVNVAIFKNGTQVWPASGWTAIGPSNTGGVSHELSLTVAAGDKIRFIVNAGATKTADTTHWDPLVQYDAWSARSGFSSTQGSKQWSYYQAYGGTYTPMSWDAANTRWQGSSTYALMGADWQHPDATDALRYWTAPKAGTVRITGSVAKQGPTFAGDGVLFKIMKNGTQLLPTSGLIGVSYDNWGGVPHDVTTNVAAGDKIYFLVNRNGTNAGDTTLWNPTVQYTTP